MTNITLPSGLTATISDGKVEFRTSNHAQLHVNLRPGYEQYWEIETHGKWVVGKEHVKQLIEALEYVLESCE